MFNFKALFVLFINDVASTFFVTIDFLNDV